jgi:[ribosomal protein S5]-alanine N-acetyltransferase
MKRLPITDLESKRLLLVPLNESHIPAMFEYSCMPEFYEHMEGLPHRNIEETIIYFHRLMDFVEAGALYWAVIKKDINKTIGTIGIRNINQENLTGDLGLGISPIYSKNGYGKETMFLAIDYFFNKLDFKLIYSLTSLNNTGSNNLMRYLGYDNFSILPDHYLKYTGSRYDAVRAELFKSKFNDNPILNDYKKKWIYDK